MAALPALTRTWYTQANVPAPSSGSANEIIKSYYFNLKTILCGQNTSGSLSTSTGTRPASSLWTVVSSSVGTGTASASDLWGTTYNSANFVSASNVSNHSWCILQNTNLGYQMLIDLNSTTNTSVRISFTKTSAPFIGVSSVSPATTAENWVLGSTSNNDSTSMANFFVDTTVGSGIHYMHISIASTGEFAVLNSRTGQNIFHNFFAFLKLDNSPVSDTRNYITIVDAVASSRGAGRASSGGWTATTAPAMRRTQNGSLLSSGGATSNYVGNAFPFDNGIDGLSNKYNVFQVQHYCTSPQHHYGGIIPDIYTCTQAANCASIPSTSAQQRVLANATIVPMIDVVPLT